MFPVSKVTTCTDFVRFFFYQAEIPTSCNASFKHWAFQAAFCSAGCSQSATAFLLSVDLASMLPPFCQTTLVCPDSLQIPVYLNWKERKYNFFFNSQCKIPFLWSSLTDTGHHPPFCFHALYYFATKLRHGGRGWGYPVLPNAFFVVSLHFSCRWH